jgi:hypothetical protein
MATIRHILCQEFLGIPATLGTLDTLGIRQDIITAMATYTIFPSMAINHTTYHQETTIMVGHKEYS